jgi:hypothetical protein
MTGGFGAAPDELFQTANAISDAVGSASGMLWQGPSGDYGHSGVQAGWGQFVEDMKAEIDKLRDKAKGHGESLKSAAIKYVESDTQASKAFSKLIERGELHGVPGSGSTGGIGRILGGLGTAGDVETHRRGKSSTDGG